MKSYFKKSQVYKNFKAEEKQELVENEECEQIDEDINQYQQKLKDLNGQYK